MSGQIKLHVDATQINKADMKAYFVCFIDIMGMKSMMSQSIRKAANFMIKLHEAVSIYTKDERNVNVYQLMDAVYIVCKQSEQMIRIVTSIFKTLYDENVKRPTKHEEQFLIRGGMAYGRLLSGDILSSITIPQKGKEPLLSKDYTKQLLLGEVVGQAYNTEQNAAPFGVAIHSSVHLGDAKIENDYYFWCGSKELGSKVNETCKTYLDFAGKNSEDEGFLKKIDIYKKRLDRYFPVSSGVATHDKESQTDSPHKTRERNIVAAIPAKIR